MTQPGALLSGAIYSGIVVVREVGRTRAGKRTYECVCHCGAEFVATGGNLKSGCTGSCGCLSRKSSRARAIKRNKKHGHATGRLSPTYVSWAAAKARCAIPSVRNWHRYGGRGIAMCDRWRGDFLAFLADMGERPAGRSLDRYPNPDGNYEPGNCRWATRIEQAANKGSCSPSVSAQPLEE